MADCLHMFRGYRVPHEIVQAVKQAIIDTPRRVDVPALRAIVLPALVAVDPWPSTPRADAAARAVDSLLFDAARVGKPLPPSPADRWAGARLLAI